MNDNLQPGHLFRSNLLDVFAGIEALIVASIDVNLRPSSTAPLGQKIEALEKQCAKSPSTFKSPAKIKKRLERLKSYLEIRGAIVHSRLEHFTDGKGEALTCFRNVGHTQAPDCYRLIMLTAQNREEIIRETSKISNELKQLTAPVPKPPSPQPPSPDATADP